MSLLSEFSSKEHLYGYVRCASGKDSDFFKLLNLVRFEETIKINDILCSFNPHPSLKARVSVKRLKVCIYFDSQSFFTLLNLVFGEIFYM